MSEQLVALRRTLPLRIALPAVVLAAAVVAAARQAPESFRAVDAQTEELAALSSLDRTLLPARAIDIDVDTLVAARKTIPPDATYALVTGDGVEVSTPVTWVGLPQFLDFWMLPRRRSGEPRGADWILAYGGDLDRLGLRYRRVLRLKPGIAFAQVER